MTEWAETQIAVARSILAFERLAEPKCDGCGSGVLRQRCMLEMGGDCPRHEPAAAFQSAVAAAEKAGGLPPHRWRRDMSLYEQIGEPPTKQFSGLLLDLIENGGAVTSRSDAVIDAYRPLRERGVASMSSMGGVNKVELGRRGLAYVIALQNAGHLVLTSTQLRKLIKPETV